VGSSALRAKEPPSHPIFSFGAFSTFQVKIAEIERLTGLTFTSGKNTSLNLVDPLDKKALRPRRRTLGLRESTSAAQAPDGYLPLTDVEDIELGD